MINTISVSKIKDIIDQCIVSPKLKDYNLFINRRGLPYKNIGGYCVNYKMEKKGSNLKCMRFWHSNEINFDPNYDHLERMKYLSTLINRKGDHIKKYFLNFEVEDNLLNVPQKAEDGTVLNPIKIPGIIMDWIDVDTLYKFVSSSDTTSKDIIMLSEKFMEMCLTLRNEGIAHGDLSAKNIMVFPVTYDIVLLDYDTLYFKEMGYEIETIKGTDGYQHPGRSNYNYKEVWCDNFSHHIIYTSLLIYADREDLRPDGDQNNLFFEREDLESVENFQKSENVKKARSIGNPKIDYELDILEKSLAGKYSEVPPLKRLSGFTKTIMTDFCNYCGKKYISSNFKFCTACGSSRHILKVSL